MESIANFLLQLMNQVGLLGLFLGMILESFFAPIPSEVLLLTAGFYAKSNGSVSDLIIISIVAALGNFVGTLPFYLISRFSRDKLLPQFVKRWGVFLLISEKEIEKAEKLFQKRGAIMIFVARLIPGIRSLIAFPAGLSKMNFGIYTLFTLLGSFIWDLVLSSIGFFAYDFKDQIFAIMKPIENLVIISLIIGGLIYVYKVIMQIRRLKSEVK